MMSVRKERHAWFPLPTHSTPPSIPSPKPTSVSISSMTCCSSSGLMLDKLVNTPSGPALLFANAAASETDPPPPPRFLPVAARPVPMALCLRCLLVCL